jgi:uncharacterized protein (TIGR03086 family)
MITGGDRRGMTFVEEEAVDSVAMMDKVLGETQRVIDGIDPSQLDDPTPCEQWTVRDVLNHITAGGDMFAIAAAEGKVPDAKLTELMTGDNLGTDFKGAFRAAAARASDAFDEPGVLDKVITLPFGEMPAGAALQIAIFDLTTHAWDLAKATGQSTALDPEVLGTALEIAQGMLADDFRAAGMFGPQLDVPADAPPQDRLAAFTGRTP